MMNARTAVSYFEKANKVIEHLKPLLPEREEVIHTAMLALPTGKNHFSIGPPGSGKTLLAEIIARGVVDADVFYKLLSKSIPVDEVLGPTSLQGIKQEDYRRAIDGFLPTAHIAILDEVYKAGDALCNPLLRMMNERKYRNGRTVVDVPLVSVFGMSNEMYEGPALAAFDSRWTFRHQVDYLSDKDSFGQMIDATRDGAVPDISEFGICLDEIAAASNELRNVAWAEGCTDILWQLREEFRNVGLPFDDRKAVWVARDVLPAEAMLQGRDYVDTEDFAILQHVLWSNPEHINQVRSIILKIANPVQDEVDRLVKSARDAFNNAKKVVDDSPGDEAHRIQAGADAQTEVSDILDTLEAKGKNLKGKSQELVVNSIKKVRRIDERIIKEILRIRS